MCLAGQATAILSDAMGTEKTSCERGAGKHRRTGLERGLGLKEAVALNMIEIVGIGPFVVSGDRDPRKWAGRKHCWRGWRARYWQRWMRLCGRNWARRCPKRAVRTCSCAKPMGRGRWGRLMSFLFVWQTFVQAPLSIASASIGFTHYVGYLHPLTKLASQSGFRRTGDFAGDSAVPADHDDWKNFVAAVGGSGWRRSCG